MSASTTSSSTEDPSLSSDDTTERNENQTDNTENSQSLMSSLSDNNPTGGDTSAKFIVQRLKELYFNLVAPAEKKYHLNNFTSLPTDGELKESEFDAAPMVLLIGQYSTGKTTFLKHLLREEFPGMHIGPEPTTDKFMALFHGGDEDDTDNMNDDAKAIEDAGFLTKRNNNDADASFKPNSSVATDGNRASSLLKGHTLTIDKNLPFSSLGQFGSAFLNHFVGSASTSSLLKRLTFIDTPGVLSGEKQRLNRTYDFGQVAKWFADRSDLILLLFDAHKLDISDEFKNIIDVIRHHNADKIRCVLNKADGVTREQLVRVYGSLMWNMGKIIHSPEVVRVYTGSYWNGKLIHDDFAEMFLQDQKLLVNELSNLPHYAAERKVNQMVNRIRLVKVHICILGTIRDKTPRFPFFTKNSSREKILNELDVILDNVRVEFNLSKGDMPDAKELAANLNKFQDFGVFPLINRSLIERLDSLVENDIPEIFSHGEQVLLENDMAAVAKDKTAKVYPGMFGRIIISFLFLLLLVVVISGVYFISFGIPVQLENEFRSFACVGSYTHDSPPPTPGVFKYKFW